MARRKRDNYDPDASGERCAYCGASYAAARNPLGYKNAGKLCSAMIAAAGRHRATADAGDGGHIRIDDAIAVMARAKRDEWRQSHGPGRCVADESSFTGRTALASVLLGFPDTAAIMAGIPEPICDDESRTIWCALPVGGGPCPPSLASIMLEQLAGDDGAADAFDELDNLRSAGGIPSAWW
jgi:hypothetical protein